MERQTKGERNECLMEYAMGPSGQEGRPSEHAQTQVSLVRREGLQNMLQHRSDSGFLENGRGQSK